MIGAEARSSTTARIGIVFTWVVLFAGPASLHAQLKPDEVPTFAVRACVTSVPGEKPDEKEFSFRHGVGGQATTARSGQWSGWLSFQRPQVEATLKGYPAMYMRGWPVVVKISMSGVVDPTIVEGQLKFDGSGRVVPLAGELYGPSLGVLVWREGIEQLDRAGFSAIMLPPDPKWRSSPLEAADVLILRPREPSK